MLVVGIFIGIALGILLYIVFDCSFETINRRQGYLECAGDYLKDVLEVESGDPAKLTLLEHHRLLMNHYRKRYNV